MNMKESILITGSTGFLGKALIKALLKNDFNLIGLHVIRDSKTTKRKSLTHEDIYIRYEDEISEKISDKNIKAIIHLATDYGSKNLKNVKSCNYDLPLKLLQITESESIEYFINADSFFSDLPDSYPHLKEYRKWKKLFRETGRKFSNNMTTHFFNMRIFHMFGPNDSSGKFVYEMQKNMEANIESIDLTECDQLRDFIYIDDVVSAFKIVLEKRYEIKEFYKNFDVGSGKKVTIKHFLDILKKTIRSSSLLNFGAIEKRKGETELELIEANNASLKNLGWKNCKNLDHNIDTLIKYKKIKES